MITTHGQVKLMDFGIAKNADEMHLTRPGMTIGSVYYMSPEQVRGGTVDARSDLYSLGITLYESLTGRKPFQADTSFTVLNAHLNEAPVPPIQVNPALSPELNKIILRSLEKNPADRFQTAQEFHDALKALVDPVVARPAAQPIAQPQAYTPTANFGGGPSATASFSPVSAAAASPVAQPVAPAPPPFAPVAAAKPAPPRASSHRGLWIGMGATVAILMLRGYCMGTAPRLLHLREAEVFIRGNGCLPLLRIRLPARSRVRRRRKPHHSPTRQGNRPLPDSLAQLARQPRRTRRARLQVPSNRTNQPSRRREPATASRTNPLMRRSHLRPAGKDPPALAARPELGSLAGLTRP